MKMYHYFSILLMLNMILYNVAKNDFFETFGLVGIVVNFFIMTWATIKDK